jgi:pyroglutamyl-peptidase
VGERTVLLTGFEPFGGDALNPSQEIVRALDGTTIGDHEIVGMLLPVSFAATLPMLDDALARLHPGIALALGQAGGRSELALERIAANLVDARIADNDGLQPIDAAVVDGAPAAYFSNLPLKAMARRLRELGIPTSLSMSAGTFVCNQVFFGLAHLVATRHPRTRCGFMHVPWLPQQAALRRGEPSMALSMMVDGVQAALACAIATRLDPAVGEGDTH